MEHDPEQTIAYLTSKIDQYVKQAGRDTVTANVEKSPVARYARVPDGNACEFCNMLGSRGFVYRSKERAGGGAMHGTKFDTWHPYCNCQIAVSYEAYIDKYVTVSARGSLTTVTRGYSLDGRVVSPGRDGSRQMREVDLAKLFKDYQDSGKEFTTPAKRRRDERRKHANLMGGTKLPDDAYMEAMQRLADAQTLDELHAIGEEIVTDWPRNELGRNAEQWNEMSRFAKQREAELKGIA